MNRAMEAWAPPPNLTVSEWADRFRRLSPESSAEPGKWETARAEYQRGMMDAITDPKVEQVVFMTSAQVGKTEIINNIVGFHIHYDPCPILVIQPTLTLGEAWSKDRLAPMARDTPEIGRVMAAERSRDKSNTLLHKTFKGGHITIAGANSAASLASRPIRLLLCDEVDRFPSSAGDEGDPLDLARQRTKNFWNRRIIEVSTPTIEGLSRIQVSYNNSDRRVFEVPCPHCDARQALTWSQIKWPEGKPRQALYHCCDCGAGWSDMERWAAVKRGTWKATAPFTGIAGFHINEIYSPWSRLGDIARAFLKVKDHPERLKTFVNTVLGETWKQKGDAPSWQRLYDRREEWGKLPKAVALITAGVDVQRDRLEISVWGWGKKRESWLVMHRVLVGDPFQDQVWTDLRDILNDTYRLEDGRTLGISAMAIDSGDGSTTARVYDFVGPKGDKRLFAVKGQDHTPSAIALPSRKQISRGGKKLPGLKVWPVGSSFIKAETYGYLNLDRPTEESGATFPAGYVHLPVDEAGEEFCRQLTAEKLVRTTDRKGGIKTEWVKERPRNEALDCRVYARAALSIIGADRWTDKKWESLLANPDKSEPQISDVVDPTPGIVATIRRPSRRMVMRSGYMG